ncbi:MAG: 50S ribosomal protein L17 [Armatimonadetes bacterium]|nr:50S ribosomal protein L17 [Armatimonadota bacterium]
MNHGISQRKLGRPGDQRKALLRGLVRSLFIHSTIVTSVTRAKEARKIAEKLITTAKTDTLQARREARKFLVDEDLVKLLFDNIVKRYETRNGGYTRIVRIGPRRGDAVEQAALSLLD